MNAAKTPAERVAAWRKVRDDLGLKRRELYAHDDDWVKIAALAMKLQMRRNKLEKKREAP